MYLNVLEKPVSRFSSDRMFGIGVHFDIRQSDKVLSTKDWESFKGWCLIFCKANDDHMMLLEKQQYKLSSLGE